MRPLQLICSLGHVATTDELFRSGVSAREIRAALHLGLIARAARGTYVCEHADAEQRQAAALHAQIACVSAVHRSDVWCGVDSALHLMRPADARGGGETARPSADPSGRSLHFHGAKPRFALAGTSWMVDPVEAVWQAIHCLNEEHAIACLESALHLKFLTASQVHHLCVLAPARLQPGIREMEDTADSGLETLTRRRLRHRGFAVVAQARVGSIYEDLVVDDCVALEIDGRQWHGATKFISDYDRDLMVEGLGRRTLRLSYRHIMYEWETTLATIERTVADARWVRDRHRGRQLRGQNEPWW
ncbi:type IV toxin-antitoxin system AbiEi family antitoxin domain-containing protein [Cryobacterium sp. Y11]|uniref:type IV toxin-antitoxin system AbiEi family antitoxin domain-containing protein n=1 Tax=Cryobacterium sp. Y11 TaxID=2045016 RepID=UPI000CE490C9|nr:type IV toxin-antitoxin system AbiEi family antitoxin domain-containing protein [Cryobacterium sp. Y11]